MPIELSDCLVVFVVNFSYLGMFAVDCVLLVTAAQVSSVIYRSLIKNILLKSMNCYILSITMRNKNLYSLCPEEIILAQQKLYNSFMNGCTLH